MMTMTVGRSVVRITTDFIPHRLLPSVGTRPSHNKRKMRLSIVAIAVMGKLPVPFYPSSHFLFYYLAISPSAGEKALLARSTTETNNNKKWTHAV